MFLDWLLKTEEYQLRRPTDVRPGQVKMESMKMETCHMAEHCRDIMTQTIVWGPGLGLREDVTTYAKQTRPDSQLCDIPAHCACVVTTNDVSERYDPAGK